MTKPSDEKESERRQHPRLDMMLKVTYRDANQFLSQFTQNISQGGTFIATNESIPKGTILDLELSFPGLLDPIPMKGVVKWHRPSLSDDQPSGVGVEFLFDQSAGRKTFQHLCTAREGALLGDGAVPSSMRLLLVEDNQVVCDMFRVGIQQFLQEKKLHHVKVEIEFASNGKEGLELLEQRPFHLLIADLYMPVMDGGTMIERIRANPKLQNLPILVVSSGGEEGRTLASDKGADAYLDKPIKLKQISETIITLIAIGHLPKKI